MYGVCLQPSHSKVKKTNLPTRKTITMEDIWLSMTKFFLSISCQFYITFRDMLEGSSSDLCGRYGTADDDLAMTGWRTVPIGLLLNYAPVIEWFIRGWLRAVNGWRAIPDSAFIHTRTYIVQAVLIFDFEIFFKPAIDIPFLKPFLTSLQNQSNFSMWWKSLNANSVCIVNSFVGHSESNFLKILYLG